MRELEKKFSGRDVVLGIRDAFLRAERETLIDLLEEPAIIRPKRWPVAVWAAAAAAIESRSVIGVKVKLPFAFRVRLPFAGPATSTAVSGLDCASLSLDRTPGAATTSAAHVNPRNPIGAA